MAAPHAFLDVLANAQIRDSYLAGRISIILSSDLETILWTNGAGAHFMGMRTVAETIGVESGFDRLTRHQIEAGLEAQKPVRVSGIPQNESFLVTATRLAPLGDVVFLRSINGQTDGEGSADLIAGLSDETTAAAVFDMEGHVMRASPNFDLDWLDAQELHLILSQAQQEKRVKKRLLQKNPSQAIGVLSLSYEPAIFLLIAAIPEEEQQEKPEQPFIFNPAQLPLQFGWRVDGEGRFEEVSPELGQVVGADYADILGKNFAQLASRWNMDEDGTLRTLFKSHNAWGGIKITWPVSGSETRVEITFFALPVYSRAREFVGFRGFALIDAMERESEPSSTQSSSVGLSPQEYEAFSIIAHTLQATLQQEEAPEQKAQQEQEEAPEQQEQQAQAADTAQTLRALSPSRLSFPLFPSANANPFSLWGKASSDPALDMSELSLLQSLPLGILIYRDENVLFANEHLLQFTGFLTLEAFRQHAILALILRDWLPKNILQRFDGEKYPIRATMRAVTWVDGEAASMISFMPQSPPQTSPVTQELHTIRNQAIELSHLLNLVSDGVLIVDAQGMIHSLNEGAQRIFKRPEAVLTGQNFLMLFVPESREILGKVFAHLRQEGKPPDIVGDLDMLAYDGEKGKRALQVHFAPMAVDEGYCLLLRDVTQLHALAFEKKQLELNPVTVNNATALMPRASHQIRTALTAIVGLSQLMLAEKYGPLNNDRYRAYLRDIASSSDQIIRLLHYLDGGASQSGEGTRFDLKPLALAPLLSEILGQISPRANERRVLVRTSLAVDLAPILVDARACRQMLMGLITNALKTTASGGQIIVSAQNLAPEGVLFRLRDTGAGLSAAEIKAITQTDPDLDFAWAILGGKEGDGNEASVRREGLGATTLLALVKKLAEANGARFHLRSELDKGTLIEIIFTLA